MGVVSRWRARLRVRKELLAAARGRGDKALARKRLSQVRYAERVLTRHYRPLRVRALQVALKEVGVVESGGNNRGTRVEQIIRANGGVPGEPWCGDFVAFCYLRAGAKSVVRAWASVRMLGQVLSRVRYPRAGHVVRYDFDHTGLFYRWVDKKGGVFEAVEGNTGTYGAVSDSVNGNDGVRIKRRFVSQVADFRRVLR